jgi:hypothetical protein
MVAGSSATWRVAQAPGLIYWFRSSTFDETHPPELRRGRAELRRGRGGCIQVRLGIDRTPDSVCRGIAEATAILDAELDAVGRNLVTFADLDYKDWTVTWHHEPGAAFSILTCSTRSALGLCQRCGRPTMTGADGQPCHEGPRGGRLHRLCKTAARRWKGDELRWFAAGALAMEACRPSWTALPPQMPRV